MLKSSLTDSSTDGHLGAYPKMTKLKQSDKLSTPRSSNNLRVLNPKNYFQT